MRRITNLFRLKVTLNRLTAKSSIDEDTDDVGWLTYNSEDYARYKAHNSHDTHNTNTRILTKKLIN